MFCVQNRHSTNICLRPVCSCACASATEFTGTSPPFSLCAREQKTLQGTFRPLVCMLPSPLTRQTSWACDLYRRAPLCLTLCCPPLKILNNFLTVPLYFYFSLSPANYVVILAVGRYAAKQGPASAEHSQAHYKKNAVRYLPALPSSTRVLCRAALGLKYLIWMSLLSLTLEFQEMEV